MKILHVVPCADEANGVYHVARMLVKKQSADGNEASVVTVRDFSTSTFNLHLVDEVYIHGMWLPREWCACLRVLWSRSAIGVPRLVRMTHGSLSPIYLERQGKWKKRLVAPIEHWLFSKTDRVVTTGEWEAKWCRQWGLKNQIETVDIKQFFDIKSKCEVEVEERTGRSFHVLYLGRRHPLKGVQYLEQAVKELNLHSSTSTLDFDSIDLHIVSETFDEALEKEWKWADVLCLPTLSENFGLVVGEALERGKPVITTDGAQAWEPPPVAAEGLGVRGQGLGVSEGRWWDRLIYLRGFRDGMDAERIQLLKDALKYFIG